jgi:predicted alpha/beta superfamily hydrolase
MQAVHSPQLQNERDIYVWLPPDYSTSSGRYPVLYMHDAQNLFDKVTGYSGDSEWEVDETMTRLHAEGIGSIVVGLPNMHELRGVEYCPYPFVSYERTSVEGKGDAYIRFIIETVKPMIDDTFHTRSEAAFTGIAGSSMGGLISMYGALAYPQVFGLCGAFSTAYWFGDNALLKTAREKSPYPGRMYLDVGTREGETVHGWLNIFGDEADRAYVQGIRDLRDALQAGGCAALMYVEAQDALHREAAWRARFPEAMRFLLKGI